MPEGVEEGILKGCYRFKAAEKGDAKVHLWGSGAIFPEALRAQQILAEKFKIGADVWSVTSYGQLRRDAIEVERWNRLHPTEDERKPLIAELFADGDQPIIAASDYMKVLPDGLTPWLPGRITSLGTDGFGRSESRDYLRRHFEVSAEAIAAAALSRLARQGKFDKRKIKKAFAELGIDTEAKNPATA
jgi:pyruvate dehydrogenase E1 component